jgi:hypothetical protein
MKHLNSQMSILRKTSVIALMIAISGMMAHAETKPARNNLRSMITGWYDLGNLRTTDAH